MLGNAAASLATATLCVMAILTLSPVTRSEPHGGYYGQVRPQSSYGHRTPYSLPGSAGGQTTPPRSRYQAGGQQAMPSCSQLRVLWKATVNELSGYLGPGASADLTKIVTNPYYLNLLTRESGDKDGPRFGRIVSGPVAGPALSRPRIPGQFDEYSLSERDLGAAGSDYSFGQVILSSDDAGPLPSGKFGSFASSNSDKDEAMVTYGRSRSKAPVMMGNGQTVKTKGQASKADSSRPSAQAKQVKLSSEPAQSESSSSRLSASDFFNSIWHDKPVKV